MLLPKPEDLDGLENIRATRHAPSSLTRALNALEKDRVLIDAIGVLLVEAHLVLKRDESLVWRVLARMILGIFTSLSFKMKIVRC